MIVRIKDILDLERQGIMSQDFLTKLSKREREQLISIISEHYNNNISWFIGHNAKSVVLCGGLYLTMKARYKRRLRGRY